MDMLTSPIAPLEACRASPRQQLSPSRKRRLSKEIGLLSVDCSSSSGPLRPDTCRSSSSSGRPTTTPLPPLSDATSSTFPYSHLDEDDEDDETFSLQSPPRQRRLPNRTTTRTVKKEEERLAADVTTLAAETTATALTTWKSPAVTPLLRPPSSSETHALVSNPPVLVRNGSMTVTPQEAEADAKANRHADESSGRQEYVVFPTTPLHYNIHNENSSSSSLEQDDTKKDLTGEDSAIRRLWNTPVRLRQGLRQRRANYLSRRAAAAAFRRHQQQIQEQQQRRLKNGTGGCPHRPKQRSTNRPLPNQRWLIPAEHPIKLLWDLLTVVLSFMNAYSTHTSIRDRQFVNNKFMHFCQIWFAVDILLNFGTELKTGDGLHLKQATRVWARYLTTWFVIDVLSLFPGELIYLQPLIDQQNRRARWQKYFFRTKAVVRVTTVLRGWHFRWFGQVAKQTRAAGLGGRGRLLHLIIKYVPKYVMFLRNMRGVVAVRLLRQVHWIRKLWLTHCKSGPFLVDPPRRFWQRRRRRAAGPRLLLLRRWRQQAQPMRQQQPPFERGDDYVYYNAKDGCFYHKDDDDNDDEEDDATYSMTTVDLEEDDFDYDVDDDGVNLSDTEIDILADDNDDDAFSISRSSQQQQNDDDDDMISLVRWELYDPDDRHLADDCSDDDDEDIGCDELILYAAADDVDDDVEDDEDDDYDDTFGPF